MEKQNNTMQVLFNVTTVLLMILLCGVLIYINDNVKGNVDDNILQPSYFFTASEYPYGNQGISLMNGDVVIKTDLNNNEITVARSAGTGSMFPTIPRDSILIMVPIYKEELIVGDIVSIKTEPYKTVHRIIKITDEGYITKGDNSKMPDYRAWAFEDLDKKLVGVLW